VFVYILLHMESDNSSSWLRERPASRVGSFASNDARHTSQRSRNSSLLPYSVRSDGSGFNYGEESTLSRAVLHTAEDDEVGSIIREARPGWHRTRRAQSPDEVESDLYEEEEERADTDNGYDSDNLAEETRRGEQAEGAGGRRRRHAALRQRKRTRSYSPFHLPPFRGAGGGGSFSTNERSSSHVSCFSPRSAPADARCGQAHARHRDAVSNHSVSSSWRERDGMSTGTLDSGASLGLQSSFLASQNKEHGGELQGRGGKAGADGATGSTRADGLVSHRRSGRFFTPPMLTRGALSAVPRSSLTSDDVANLMTSSSSVVGTTLSPTFRQRCSVLPLLQAGEARDVVSSPLGKRDGGEGRCGVSSVDSAASASTHCTTPFPDGGMGDDSKENPLSSSFAAAPPVEDHVWPFTQPLAVRLVMIEVCKRIAWNQAVRQFLLLVPLVFLVGFLAAYNTAALHAGLLVTEAQQQIFDRTPFPSTATAMERFRQQKALDIPTAVPTDRLFVDIHTQTDWIDYICDALLPGIFPGVDQVLNLTAELPKNCRGQAGDGRGSGNESDDGCFSDGHFWWDKPGCLDSYSDENANPYARDLSGMADTADTKRSGLAAWKTANKFGGDSSGSSSKGGKANANVAGAQAGMASNISGKSSDSSTSTSSGANPCSPESLMYDKPALIGPAQNYYLGAMRVRTIRMRPHTAKLQRSLYPISTDEFPFDAWSRHHSRDAEETTPSRCPSITLRNGITNVSTPLYVYRAPEANDPYCVATTGRFGVYHCGGYAFDVPFRSSRWLAAQYHHALRNSSCFFVDNWATRLAVVEFFTYTPDHDTFHMVKLRSEVLAGGNYYNEAIYRSFRVWTSSWTGELVYATFTLVYGVVYLVFLFCRLRWQVRWFGLAATVQDWSAWMDLGMVTAVVVAVSYYYAWAQLSQEVSDQLALPMLSNAYPSFLDSIQSLYDSFTVATAFSVILCFARLLFCRAFFRPMETFVTTLELSFPTLFATAILAMTLFIGYALSAHAVFGPVCESYTNFGDALYAVLSYWYAVSLVVPSEEAVARVFTSLFFWSLTVVLLSLLMATFTAVVSNSFDRIQAVYGVTYDELWLVRCVKTFGRWCSWAHFKRFVAKMVMVYAENECLLSVLESMTTNYADDTTDKNDVDSTSWLSPRGYPAPGAAGVQGEASFLAVAKQQADSATTGCKHTLEEGVHAIATTSSSTAPSSFSDKRKRLLSSATIVEGQAVEQGSSNLSVQRQPKRQFSHDKRGTSQSSNCPAEAPAPSGTGATSLPHNSAAAAQARQLAALSFSAVEVQKPLAPASSSPAFPHSSNDGGTTNRGGHFSDANRGSARCFRSSLRRASDELREISDELRALTVAQRRIDLFTWCEMIPRDVVVRCGGMPYFKEWWREMAEAQADVSRTPQQQACCEFRGKVAVAAEREVAGGIVGIGHLENTLTQLELHVDSLLQNVSKRQL
jgi:hypothetical protein